MSGEARSQGITSDGASCCSSELPHRSIPSQTPNRGVSSTHGHHPSSLIEESVSASVCGSSASIASNQGSRPCRCAANADKTAWCVSVGRDRTTLDLPEHIRRSACRLLPHRCRGSRGRVSHCLALAPPEAWAGGRPVPRRRGRPRANNANRCVRPPCTTGRDRQDVPTDRRPRDRQPLVGARI